MNERTSMMAQIATTLHKPQHIAIIRKEESYERGEQARVYRVSYQYVDHLVRPAPTVSHGRGSSPGSYRVTPERLFWRI